MIFGIGSMMLIMGVGAALDFASLSSQAKTLQDYTDAAVLAAATSGAETQAELDIIVGNALAAHNQKGLVINYTVQLDADDLIIVNTSVDYDPLLMGAFGHNNLGSSVQSAAPRGNSTPLNLAFVLDTTFSMTGQNMTDLRVAASGLVDKLDALDNDEIRMSVVPFAEYVNVGMANRNASWMNVATDYSTQGPEVCNPYQPTTTSGCQTEERTGYRDGVSYTYTATFGCTYTPSGPEEMRCYTPTTTSSTWNGCAGSRNAPKNTKAEVNGIGSRVPGAKNIRPYPFSGYQVPQCGAEILPLTATYADVKTRINSMNPTGVATYIPTGLLWGWRTLEAADPYPAGTSAQSGPNEPAIKALILMTDGANTAFLQDEYHIKEDPVGSGVDGTNTHTEETCDAIKADGITLYTVAYNFSGTATGTRDLIEACASSPSNFFDANGGAELTEAFEKIGNQLFSIRLAYVP